MSCPGSIYTAKNPDEWEYCSRKRGVVIGISMVIIVTVIMLLAWKDNPSQGKHLLLTWFGITAVISLVVWNVSGNGRAEYELLHEEHERLRSMDPKYNSWSEFVKYKQSERRPQRSSDGDLATGILIGALLSPLSRKK